VTNHDGSHERARELYETFLPPPDFRGLGARYEMHHHLGLAETLRAWDAARAWAPRDGEPREAMHNAEQHLRRLRPRAMAHYDEGRSADADPGGAVRSAMAQTLGAPAGQLAPPAPPLVPGSDSRVRELG
jgi:predicted acyl esterase